MIVRSNLLTKSRLETARSCARKHHLSYELGYDAVSEADTLRFGTLVHSGLEAWWKAKQAGKPQSEWLQEALGVIGLATDPFEHIKAAVLMQGYHARWKDEPYEVLAVEMRFYQELRNPATGAASRTWKLGGKIDVIARDLRDGRVFIVEHKTSSEDITPGSPYWRMLRIDTQVSVYFVGAESLGYTVAGCLYDVLGKPQLHPKGIAVVEDGAKVVLDANGVRVKTKDGKKWRETADTEQGYVLQTRPETPMEFGERIRTAIAESPDRFFARGEVVRLEQEVSDAIVDVWQTGQQMRENELANRHPRNPGACKSYGRMCEFFDVCTGAASIEDTNLFQQRALVHPELADENTTESTDKESNQ